MWVQGQIAVLGYSVTQVLDKLSLDTDIPILKYCFDHSWNLLRHNNEKKLLFILALQPEAVSRVALKEIAGIEDVDSFDNAISDLLSYMIEQVWAGIIQYYALTAGLYAAILVPNIHQTS